MEKMRILIGVLCILVPITLATVGTLLFVQKKEGETDDEAREKFEGNRKTFTVPCIMMCVLFGVSLIIYAIATA